MSYSKLLIMAFFSFIAMFVLMYAMVDSTRNIYIQLNQFYMAGLMTMPMIIIELLVMRSMYGNKKLNKIIIISSLLLAVLLFFAIRKQYAISDKEFLKSMIPHHAAALLMCKATVLQDPELDKLCKNIMTTQQAEIDFMKSKLAALPD